MNAALLSLFLAAGVHTIQPVAPHAPITLAGGAKQVSLVLDRDTLSERGSKVMPTVYRSGIVNRVRDVSAKRLPEA